MPFSLLFLVLLALSAVALPQVSGQCPLRMLHLALCQHTADLPSLAWNTSVAGNSRTGLRPGLPARTQLPGWLWQFLQTRHIDTWRRKLSCPYPPDPFPSIFQSVATPSSLQREPETRGPARSRAWKIVGGVRVPWGWDSNLASLAPECMLIPTTLYSQPLIHLESWG